MIISLFGHRLDPEVRPMVERLFVRLGEAGCSFTVHERFWPFVKEMRFVRDSVRLVHSHQDLLPTDMLLSFGGDGTLLDSVKVVRTSGVPVLGINTGRLGFLSNVAIDEVDEAARFVTERRFKLDPRTLIRVERPGLSPFSDWDYAMNEVTIHKKDSASMIEVEARLDGEFMNSYWADGLIVATPTGSTAYSLSCGGPIVVPGSRTFVVTPIAPHNLTMRPAIVPDTAVLSFSATGRDDAAWITLDSMSYELQNGETINLRLADFQINLVDLDYQTYFGTIRNKMMWGRDTRN
jgi:NAD+ kinase